MNATTSFCFGIEQEHPPITLRDDGKPQTTENLEAFYQLQKAVRKAGVPYMGDEGGMFTPYGRLYLEGVGKHVEIGVSPCGNPDEALKTELRFTRVLQDALMTVREKLPGLNLLKNNVDYITHSTWASHESYAVTMRPEELKDALLPFLITRQVFAGSGTLFGGVMRLSPRAFFMTCESGGDTTRERAIFSTCRQEPLMKSGTFISRLHLIVGDGLMSQFGQWLKLGVTALVVRAAELDPTIGGYVRFKEPVQAIKLLTKMEPTGAQLINQKLLTVQRHYLHAVNRMLERFSFPTWCEEVAETWAEVLDILEQDPRALGDRLDAYIKLRLFDEYLQSNNKTWSDMRRASDVYFRMAMLDVQYHCLVDSIFGELDRAGVLAHRKFEDHEVEPGNEPEPYIPDALPREILRARIIKTYSGQPDYWCDWGVVVDRKNKRLLKIDDPFSHEAAWVYCDQEPYSDAYMERLLLRRHRYLRESADEERRQRLTRINDPQQVLDLLRSSVLSTEEYPEDPEEEIV